MKTKLENILAELDAIDKIDITSMEVMLDVLQKIVEQGNTVIVIEHNLDVIKLADYIIDMGPEGGRGGGQVLSTGTPEEVAESKLGYTPPFIKDELK